MMWSLLALSGLCHAGTIDAAVLSLPELTDAAEQVVVGSVRALHAEARGPGIETVVEVSVRDTLLGAPVSVATFRIPGGVLDGIELTVSGAPQLAAGDEVLVFLHDEQLVGLGQGAFHVTDGVAWRVQAPLALPLDEVRRELR